MVECAVIQATQNSTAHARMVYTAGFVNAWTRARHVRVKMAEAVIISANQSSPASAGPGTMDTNVRNTTPALM